MSQSLYTVTITKSYVDPLTKVPYLFHAGDRIPLERAISLGMPGAVAPADPTDLSAADEALVETLIDAPKTIHNYFPDGAISSAALIDLANDQDYDAHVWENIIGTETLAFAAGPPNYVQVDCPGDAFGEGLWAEDWENHYGCRDVEAGRWFIGLTAYASKSVRVEIATVAAYPPGHSGDYVAPEYIPNQHVDLTTSPHRFVLDVRTLSPGRIGFWVVTSNVGLAVDASPSSCSLYVGKVTVTEGDATVFADGDSAGWTWLGAHHTSPSIGPQL